jgi:hypothetical protein
MQDQQPRTKEAAHMNDENESVASAVSVVAWAVVCGDCVDSTFTDRDEAVAWASGLIPPAHIVPLYRRHDAMTLTNNERVAIQWVVGDGLAVDGVSIQATLRGLLERTK